MMGAFNRVSDVKVLRLALLDPWDYTFWSDLLLLLLLRQSDVALDKQLYILLTFIVPVTDYNHG